MGAENPDTASHQRDRRQPTDLALTLSSPRSMISRCGLSTRVPDARPRVELAVAARPLRRSQGRRDPGGGDHLPPTVPGPTAHLTGRRGVAIRLCASRREGPRSSDAEHGEARCHREQLLVGRVLAEPLEEAADLPGPLSQVVPKDRRLVGVGQLDHGDGLHAAAEPQLATPGHPDVAHPLGVAPRRDEIPHAVDRHQVHRRGAPLPRLPAAYGQDPAAHEADAEPGQGGDHAVEDRVDGLGDEVAGRAGHRNLPCERALSVPAVPSGSLRRREFASVEVTQV